MSQAPDETTDEEDDFDASFIPGIQAECPLCGHDQLAHFAGSTYLCMGCGNGVIVPSARDESLQE